MFLVSVDALFNLSPWMHRLHRKSVDPDQLASSNSLDSDQVKCFIGPDLGPQLFAKVSSR